jgi:nucleoside-diphosphate kinase
MERTFVLIKPDAVARGLAGRIVSRFEDAGLTIERMEMVTLSREQAGRNYAEHEGKPFYDGLVEYVTSGRVVKMVIAGDGAVATCRKLIGATDPAEAAPGTIRGDFGLVLDANLIHGSDSPESAERETGIFFG